MRLPRHQGLEEAKRGYWGDCEEPLQERQEGLFGVRDSRAEQVSGRSGEGGLDLAIATTQGRDSAWREAEPHVPAETAIERKAEEPDCSSIPRDIARRASTTSTTSATTATSSQSESRNSLSSSYSTKEREAAKGRAWNSGLIW